MQVAQYETMVEATDMLPALPPRKSAVFVAHGMGQQLRYETVDQIAQGLLEFDAKQRNGKSKQPDTEVITLPCEGGLLRGIKLLLLDKDSRDENAEPANREVHIFEGYWSPLTEGEISLRDVISFLVTAALNGLRNGTADINRWLFGKYRSYRTNLNVTLYLITAIAAVFSLVVMNTAIVTVAALSSPFTKGPAWLPKLKPDLTTTFNIFVFFALLLGLALLFSSLARTRSGMARTKYWSESALKRMAAVSWALLALTLGATILCGLAIPVLFYGHVYKTSIAGFWETAFGSDAINLVNCFINVFFISVVVVGILWLIFGRKRKPSKHGWWQRLKDSSGWVWMAVLTVSGLLLAVIGKLLVVVCTAPPITAELSPDSFCSSINGISWPLLIIVSWAVKRLLVQYVGDVAVYVTPHSLDRFNSLRERIRETVVGAAKTVYMARKPDSREFEYDDLFVVGHSLGSVIVYDTLNRLINDDEFLENQAKLQVAKRTRLLLTFGSPLDKLTFLFAAQKEKTSEEREAMSGAAQPLIQQPEFRKFDWINLYSDQDIISGSLDYFDPPPEDEDQVLITRVKNEVDPKATTLLAAHVEYWRNELLFKRLHEKLMEKSPPNAGA